jgi:hypothetical protein
MGHSFPGSEPRRSPILQCEGSAPPNMQSLKEKFDKKWEPVPFSGCWLWTDSCHRSGYGQLFVRSRTNRFAKNVRAHRLSWELHNGEIPEGQYVLHKCDVRSCVNPDHLFLGTHEENMIDMCRKRGWNYERS